MIVTLTIVSSLIIYSVTAGIVYQIATKSGKTKDASITISMLWPFTVFIFMGIELVNCLHGLQQHKINNKKSEPITCDTCHQKLSQGIYR